MTPAGFPHSDIHGSRPAFGYPWLFVDRYVLLRLPVPRHPPCALLSLTCQQLLAVVFANHARITFLWVLISFHSRTLQFNAWVFCFAFLASHSFCFFFIQFSRYRCAVEQFAATVPLGQSLRLTSTLAGLGFCRISPAPAGGGLKWTRTTDLTLIRRAL